MKNKILCRILYFIFLFSILPLIQGYSHVFTNNSARSACTVAPNACSFRAGELSRMDQQQAGLPGKRYMSKALPTGSGNRAGYAETRQLTALPGELLFLTDSAISLHLTMADEKVIRTYNDMGLPLAENYFQKAGSDWENTFRYGYTYDERGNRLSYLFQIWDNGAWLNQSITYNTFDDNNNLMTTLNKNWNGIGWLNYSLRTCTYNPGNKILTDQYQKWEYGQWENRILNTYSYDPGNRVVWTLEQYSNGNSWLNMNLYIYNYYTDSTEKLYQKWNGSTWQDMGLEIFKKDSLSGWEVYISRYWNYVSWLNETIDSTLHDANGNMLSYQRQEWDQGFSIWSNKTKYIYTYDDQNNLLTTLQQNGLYFDWTNYYFTSCTYDGSGLLLTKRNQEWINQGGVSSWVSVDSLSDEYDANHNLIHSTSFGYNGSGLDPVSKVDYEYLDGHVLGDGFKWSGGAWIPAEESIPVSVYVNGKQLKLEEGAGYHEDVYYSTLITSADPGYKDPGMEISAYPDPVDDILGLRMYFDKDDQIRISLLDISGKLESAVYEGSVMQGDNALSLNMKNEKAGLHLLRVSSNSGNVQLKICVVH
ncbi:MAG: T9SS type A sorting domain-containing protein [Bacteroidetes bacterium]|nr:T9SS type A sorting domain-containing protein [Bacteroidota bacterium]